MLDQRQGTLKTSSEINKYKRFDMTLLLFITFRVCVVAKLFMVLYSTGCMYENLEKSSDICCFRVSVHPIYKLKLQFKRLSDTVWC